MSANSIRRVIIQTENKLKRQESTVEDTRAHLNALNEMLKLEEAAASKSTAKRG